MDGIGTIEQLENTLGVETGDLVMCTYDPYPHTPKGTSLDIAVGIYNPFQGINGEAISPGDVNFTYETQQKVDLIKSDQNIRVHLIGHGYRPNPLMKNSTLQTQIPVPSIFDFKVLMKSIEVTEFYRNSI